MTTPSTTYAPAAAEGDLPIYRHRVKFRDRRDKATVTELESRIGPGETIE